MQIKYDWNDRLLDELAVKWRDWKKGLASLTSYSIPRSFTPRDFGEVERAELHHFADTSEGHGYGTVTYLCFVNKRRRHPQQFRDGQIVSEAIKKWC